MDSRPGSQIRPARPEDLEAIVALCGEHAAFEQAAFSAEGKAEMLRRALFYPPSRAWCLVVQYGNEIVGYAACSPEFSTWMGCEYLHMDCMYLRPKHRGLGLGSRVMAEIVHLARDLGCGCMEWQTPAWNLDAARFYDRVGGVSSPKLRYRKIV
jgi:GNAT superfamily N-acetyltransferase